MGRLLKGTGRVVPAPVLAAREQAALILADARGELARARAEADGLRQEVARRGYEAGFEAGRDAGLASVTGLIAAAHVEADAVRARTRDLAVVLARRMAEKVVGRAVELSPEVMGDIAAQALAASRPRAGRLVLRVHPEDLAATEAARARWRERLPAEVEVQVVEDAAVGRSGCVVETPVGRLDARLDTQLDALERALAGARPRSTNGARG